MEARAQAGEQAVRDLHRTWIAAVNAGDLDELFALMADDVVFVSPANEPIGRAGFRAGFTAGHRNFRLLCTSDLEEVVVAGAVAHTLSKDSLTLAPREGGATTRLAGHRLTIYRRQPDGRWLLARDAHTLAPAPG